MNLPAAANSNPSTILSSSAISSSSQTNLVRKHSCGDLVSRLKSRKLLGVGENSEHRGEVYRSKISQLLGHSEHLFTRFPLAFWHWYACLIILNVLSGLWNLSGHLFLRRQAGTQQESDNSRDKVEQVNDLLAISTFFRQFCGILYLVFATLLWRFYRINDKGLVRYILLICSVFSIAKIILMLYYDHCNVIALKDWLVSFICSSQCSQDLSLPGAASVPSCSRFSGTSSPPIIASFELTTYIVCDSIEVLGNLWYRRKMGHNASGSNSLLATAAMGSRRVSAHQAASTCEYASFFFSTYLLGPVARLFRLSSDDQHSSTTPNISAPASPTTPNPNGIPEESEDAEMANASVCEKDAEQTVEGEHHHQQ